MSISNLLGSRSGPHFVGSGLDPNCLQRLSMADTRQSKKRKKKASIIARYLEQFNDSLLMKLNPKRDNIRIYETCD